MEGKNDGDDELTGAATGENTTGDELMLSLDQGQVSETLDQKRRSGGDCVFLQAWNGINRAGWGRRICG